VPPQAQAGVSSPTPGLRRKLTTSLALSLHEVRPCAVPDAKAVQMA
jgi:hypothetical protein